MTFCLGTTLKQDFESFLKNEIGNEFADILIYFNEQSPPLLGHKCILAARCAYFEAYFRSFMPKDRKVLVCFVCLNIFRKKNKIKYVVNFIFLMKKDDHWWHGTSEASVYVAVEIHLLWRCGNATSRRALSHFGQSLFSIFQPQVVHIL